MSQFVSALELATYFDGITDLAELTPAWVAQANILLEMISADVEAAAGVPIEAGSGTVVLAGTWNRDLALPVGPIRAVDAVTVNGIAVDAAGWYWNERALIRRGLDAANASGIEVDYVENHQGALTRSGRPWGGPFATVLVEYDYGFDDVPDIIRALTLRVAARTFGNVGSVVQESLGVYSATYGRTTAGNEDGSHVTKPERARLRRLFNQIGGTIHAGGR